VSKVVISFNGGRQLLDRWIVGLILHLWTQVDLYSW